MKKLYSLLLTALFALPAAHVHATDYTQGLSIWFDTLSGEEDLILREEPMPTGM